MQAVPREVVAAVALLHLAEEAAGSLERSEPALHPAAESPVEVRPVGRLEPALHPAASVPVPPAEPSGSVLHPAASVPVRPAGPWEPALHRAASVPARLAARAQREPVDEGRRAECSDSC